MKSKSSMRPTKVNFESQEAERMFSRRFNYANASRALQVVLCLATVIGIQAVGFADPPQGTERKIVSEDFTKNRQEAASGSSKPKPRRTYRLASQPTTKTRP